MPSDVVHSVFTTAMETDPRFRVCRLDLLPLTVGHIFVLREYGSPFLSGAGRDKSLGDVLLAAFICSQPWEKSRRDLLHPRLERWVGKWGRLCRGIEIGHEAEKFTKYLAHYFASPTRAEMPTGRLESPEEWTLLAMLMSEFHMTEETALSKSVAFATALWCAQAERTGRVKFTRTDESWTQLVARAWNHQHRIDLALAEANKARSN